MPKLDPDRPRNPHALALNAEANRVRWAGHVPLNYRLHDLPEAARREVADLIASKRAEQQAAAADRETATARAEDGSYDAIAPTT